MRKIRSVALLALSLLAPIDINAKDSDDKNNQESVFNFDIFSLSKKKENAFDAASATYILSSEDIRRSGATSIPEALRMIPGIQVSRIDGNKWAITARGFNRQFSNKLLVMIDGRTVYTTLFSGVFWDLHDYVVEDIEKIEVVRGPGGTIWGTNAVNGVINIITKSAAQTQGTYASQLVGNQDTSITELRYGGKTASNDHYRLYGKRAVRQGNNLYSDNDISNRDGNMQNRMGFRYDVTSIKNNTVSVHGDFYSGVAANYFPTLLGTDKQDKNSNGTNVVVNWSKTLSKKSSFTMQTYLDYNHFALPVLMRRDTTFDFDFQHFYNFTAQNQFIWGFGYRRIDDNIETQTALTSGGSPYIPIAYTPAKQTYEVASAFIQDKIGMIDDKMYLTIGSKFEHNSYTGLQIQPNARITYYPSRNQTLWAAISGAVRTPTRGEFGGFNIKSNGTTINLGSTDYKSENLLAYEVGYRIKPTTKVLFDATAFYNRYTALRTYEIGVGGAPTADNMGFGQSFGAEFVAKWQATKDWRMEVSYDYLALNLGTKRGSTDATSVLGAADRLVLAEGQSPKNQFRLRSFYNINSKIEFDNMLYYVDSLPLAKTSSSDRKGIPSYIRFDTRVGFLVSKNLDLSAGVQNLFDANHSEFKAALYDRRTEVPRTFFLKAVWQY